MRRLKRLLLVLYPDALDRGVATRRSAESNRRIATERRPLHSCSRAGTAKR